MVKKNLKTFVLAFIIGIIFLFLFCLFIKFATAGLRPAGGGDTFTTDVTIDNQKSLKLYELDVNGSNYVAIQSSAALAGNTTYVLPAADGSAGQVLETNGSGVLSWGDDAGASGGAPTAATYITQTGHADLSAEQALGDLATGILKNTTTTGVVSIAVAGTDYAPSTNTVTGTNPIAVSGGTLGVDNTLSLNYSTNMFLIDVTGKFAWGYNSSDFSLAGSSTSIVSGITRDTEWDTISEINAVTTDADIIATNSEWTGGDLGGTGLAAEVTDDSHSHTGSSISNIDISADTNLSATNPIVLTGDVLSLNYATTNLLLNIEGKLSVGYNSNHFSVSGSSMSIVTDGIDDTLIDWGSGANQVDLADIPGGIAGASAFDFGGSTSVEVPNGTSPTVNAAGEIAVDTSATTGAGIRYYADAEYFVPAYLSKSFVLVNPTSDSDYSVWRVPYGITIKAIHLLVTSGTNLIGGLDEADGNGANAVAVDSDITGSAGTNANDDGSLTNPTIDANDYINWHTTSNSGAPTHATVTFDFIVTP